MIISMIRMILAAGLWGAAGVFLLSKCLFLAPYRAGGVLLIANLAYEIAERKLRCSRIRLDALLYPLLVFGFWLWAGPAVAAWAALVLGGSWAWVLRLDANVHGGQLARQSRTLKGRVPLPVPQLIVSIHGPVLERRRNVDDLGDWPEGLEQNFVVRILNPSPVCAQLPLSVHVVSASDAIEVLGSSGGERSGPASGELAVIPFSLRAVQSGSGGDVHVQVQHGDFHVQRILRIRSILPKGNVELCGAEIRRWKNGARGAFVWRGDQDLYDPATFQSEEGLRVTLGLARRFRMPSSLMLSARLSLDAKEHRAFCEHYGWDRKTGEIQEFIRFLREEVDKTVEQEWPTATERPFAMEIGNHFYLHYGTHAAAAAENGWKSHAGIGEGTYPWVQDPSEGSFGEQRDNALKCSEVFHETLGIDSASFTIPSDVFDGETARALEAAGLEVGSETDASKWSKLLRIPPPHHPAGCDRFVELTRMHPRDPENACQLAMLKYWVGAARRTGRAFVFLAHHHLTRYEGETSFHLTEELLRHVLADQNSDLFVGTLTAVGRYWRDVLSERTRCIRIEQEQNRITVENFGSRDLESLPLEIKLSGGRSHLRLISVQAHSSVTVEV